MMKLLLAVVVVLLLLLLWYYHSGQEHLNCDHSLVPSRYDGSLHYADQGSAASLRNQLGNTAEGFGGGRGPRPLEGFDNSPWDYTKHTKDARLGKYADLQAAEGERAAVENNGFAQTINVRKLNAVKKKPQRSFMQLSDGERLQYIIDHYFTEEEDVGPIDQTNNENNYINSLPVDGNCADQYSECAKWARNGECNINPEYMLYVCPGSCKACSLTPEQKNDITVIYSNRDPTHCVNHGQNYPGVFPYMLQLYTYSNDFGI